MKKSRIIGITVLALLPLLIPAALICAFLFAFNQEPVITETTDVADYGMYTGNYDNGTPSEFITSFFPAAIDNRFSNVTYHYKAKKFDTYAYEVWLEFVIEDSELFFDFIAEHTDQEACVPFLYDESYTDYTISNYLHIHTEHEDVLYNAETGYPIEKATIGKILYSESEQRIIFWALGMYDGGGTRTTELNHFFSYFDIDPAEYVKNVDSPFRSHTPTKTTPKMEVIT